MDKGKRGCPGPTRGVHLHYASTDQGGRDLATDIPAGDQVSLFPLFMWLSALIDNIYSNQ